MTPTQCKLQTASPIGLLISFHFSGTAGLLSGPPSYCYLRNCHDPIIIFCMTDIWSYKCKLKLTWPDFVHIKSITSEIKLLLNMLLFEAAKRYQIDLPTFGRHRVAKNRVKHSKTTDAKHARSVSSKFSAHFAGLRLVNSVLRSLLAVIPVVALFSDPANQ